jgi:maleate isomerase
MIESKVSPRRLGMLTPSSNTVLEPVCGSILAGLGDVSVHFSRFRVTEISLSDAANDQFSREGMLHAAELLADARVNSICWNGTSASWLGLDRDRDLCGAIEHATGVSATSSVLTMVELLRGAGIRRLGLVSPYIDRVQRQIGETLAAEDFEVVAERHLDLSDNFAFAEVTVQQIEDMIRATALAKPQAVLVMCTNLRAAPLVEALERELGVPILDSVAAAIWGGLRIAGVDPRRVHGWGRIFAGLDPSAVQPLQ